MSTRQEATSGAPNVPQQLTVRRWLHAWLLDSHIEGNYQKTIDRFIAALIIANLFALMFEHVPGVFEPNKAWFHFFDVVSVAIFSVEYLVRLYLAPEDEEFKHSKFPRLAYFFSPFAVIDLLAIAPFYLTMFLTVDLRVLRALRLLRMFKLLRVLIPAAHEFRKQIGRAHV